MNVNREGGLEVVAIDESKATKKYTPESLDFTTPF
jgi:hypothetical protein